jgi:putative PIN family toxin of toxin-antitoxin system
VRNTSNYVLRVVLNTSIVVAALRSRRGASSIVLRLVAEGRIVALATTALFLEYEDVLARPEQRAADGLSARQIEDVLSALASVIEPVTVHISWRPQLRDPSDEMVLEAAANGQANAVVTFNLSAFVPAGRFGVLVLRPADVLDRIQS